MKENMVATTGAMGITGLKYIEITGGTNKSAPLKPGSEIPTKVSVFSSITGKAESIVAKIELLLNHLNEISNPDSLRSAKVILDNVAQITKDVRGFVGESSPQIMEITKSSSQMITKVDSIAGNIQTITSDFKSLIKPEEIAVTFSRIDSTVISLKQLSDQLSLMVRQSKEDFTISMENIREASENANQLTKIIAENPTLLLRNETQKERDIR
jgi:phospholipid/cholesterol/gamma-HCH transport system substrate-binding protein